MHELEKKKKKKRKNHKCYLQKRLSGERKEEGKSNVM